jgi:two-component system sensor histidine kinase KdpD
MDAEHRQELARTAGLREFATPKLEDVDRRRSQLWVLSLLVGLAVPGAMVALGFDVFGDWFDGMMDLAKVRLILLALLVAILGYVAEREHALRHLTELLVDERVLTAALVARVEELDLLLRASKAMNSTLQPHRVLEVILRSASDLLRAAEGSIQLICPDDPDMLEVAAVHGATTARLGQRQVIGEGVAGQVAASREALLVTGPHAASRRVRALGSALVVPLEHRGALVGILNLSVEQDGEQFTEFQLRSVAVFAETASAAIANARNHQSTEEQVAALTELDRMKGEFLTLVTHELRTPLTSLIGLTSTIAGNIGRLDPEEIQQLAEKSRRQGWRLERLVGDLLASSAAVHGALELTPATIDVGALVDELVTGLAAATPNHLITALPRKEPLVRCIDADAVARIVANLVGNAVKYSPGDTTVEVGVRPWADGIALVVVDQGPGIPADERAALFDKFRRGAASSATAGLGLGLYIVRSLATAHGGDATVTPGARGGSEFVVTLADLSERVHAGAPA